METTNDTKELLLLVVVVVVIQYTCNDMIWYDIYIIPHGVCFYLPELEHGFGDTFHPPIYSLYNIYLHSHSIINNNVHTHHICCCWWCWWCIHLLDINELGRRSFGFLQMSLWLNVLVSVWVRFFKDSTRMAQRSCSSLWMGEKQWCIPAGQSRELWHHHHHHHHHHSKRCLHSRGSADFQKMIIIMSVSREDPPADWSSLALGYQLRAPWQRRPRPKHTHTPHYKYFFCMSSFSLGSPQQ